MEMKKQKRRHSIIDEQGFRANVGIILSNDEGRLFLAKRIGADAWQFPQGGIRPHESTKVAMFRELQEETGLEEGDVEVVGCTRDWLHYRLPERYIRRHSRPLCIGQKQLWYLLRLTAGEDKVRLNISKRPEFELWRWVDFWEPLDIVIEFKRQVYRRALTELEPLLFSN